MDKNKDLEEFENCFICGTSLPKGIGKFRKLEKVYCIKCYKDKIISYKILESDEGSKWFSFDNRNLSNDIIGQV